MHMEDMIGATGDTREEARKGRSMSVMGGCGSGHDIPLMTTPIELNFPKNIDNGTNNNYKEWKIKSYHKFLEWDLWKYIKGPTSKPFVIPPLPVKLSPTMGSTLMATHLLLYNTVTLLNTNKPLRMLDPG